jgi:hypothetical protein
MSESFKPIYKAQIRLKRFIFYFCIVILLLMSFFLPFGVYLINIQLALVCLGMAIYQWWEWSRLTPYEELRIENNSVLYRIKNQEERLPFSALAITFLYYSSIDKSLGCATLCLRLKTGQTYRFCGINQVDKLLPLIKLE